MMESLQASVQATDYVLIYTYIYSLSLSLVVNYLHPVHRQKFPLPGGRGKRLNAFSIFDE